MKLNGAVFEDILGHGISVREANDIQDDKGDRYALTLQFGEDQRTLDTAGAKALGEWLAAWAKERDAKEEAAR